MDIIAATTKDIGAIQALAYAIWPLVYKDIITLEQIDYMLNTRYSEVSLLEQMTAGQQFFIATEDNLPQGYAAVAPTDQANTFKLEKLYVTPTVHKTGIGGLLLQAVEKHIIEKGGEELILQVNRQNNAVKFYLKKYFFIDKEMDVSIGNGYYMNDYLMRKVLQNKNKVL